MAESYLQPPTPLVVSSIPSTDFVTNTSPDGLAATILFNPTFSAELSADAEIDTSVTSTAFYLPLRFPDPKESFRGMALHVHGNLSKDAGARIAVMMDLGGTCQTIEYPYGKSLNEDVKFSVFAFEGHATQIPTDVENQWVATQLPPATHCSVIVTITTQRRGAGHTALFQLDSMDLEIIDLEKKEDEEESPPKKAAYK